MSTTLRRRASSLYVAPVGGGGGGGTYVATVLADNPQAYYRLAETSGTTMVDASPNARNGTYTGSNLVLNQATALSLDLDAAARFNGSTYGNVPSASWLNGNSVTYEAWVKVLAGYSGNAGIVGRWGVGTDTAVLYLNSSGCPSIIGVYGGSNYSAQWGSQFVQGWWYHVVGTMDGTNVRLYINGVQVVTTPITSGSLPTSSVPLQVGAFSSGGSGLNNTIVDEVSAYGTALSAARVLAHYKAGRGAYQSEIMVDFPWGYWMCNETSGSTLVDLTGFNPMTITGSPTLGATPGVGTTTTPAIAWPNSTTVNAITANTPNATASWTLEAWVYMTAFPTTQVTVLSPANSTTGDSGSESGIGVDTAGKPYVTWWISGTDLQLTSASALSLNTWHHIVGIGDASGGGAVRLRVDKTTVAGPQVSSLSNVQFHPLRLHAGKRNSGGDIRIAHAAYYRGALTDARIDAHYDAAFV